MNQRQNFPIISSITVRCFIFAKFVCHHLYFMRSFLNNIRHGTYRMEFSIHLTILKGIKNKFTVKFYGKTSST